MYKHCSYICCSYSTKKVRLHNKTLCCLINFMTNVSYVCLCASPPLFMTLLFYCYTSSSSFNIIFILLMHAYHANDKMSIQRNIDNFTKEKKKLS